MGIFDPTNLSDKDKNKAYLIYSEWGPNLSIDRTERLTKEFPQADQQTIEGWIHDFKAVDSTVYACAREGGSRAFNEQTFRKRIHNGHPWITAKAVERAWFLACYYAWHDGYDS